MTRRLVAIGLIFAAVSAAWMILSGSIFYRTHNADSNLKAGVQSLWGSEQRQVAPSASYTERLEPENEDGTKPHAKTARKETRPIPLTGSRIRVDLDLSHRQKGLLWYATYKVKFAGSYRFTNDTGVARDVRINFPFPDRRAVYDDFAFAVNGKPWKSTPASADGCVTGVVSMAPGETIEVNAAYSSQGLDNWRYGFGEGVTEIRNFQLAMHTNFRDIDYPADGLAPTSKRTSDKGWDLLWEYTRLVSGTQIGMVMPQKLQPGPLAGEIAAFAPVSLLFFVVVTWVIAVIRRLDIHPMHYAFIAGAFFSFHLLLAYLADQIAFGAAFAIAAAASVFLVVSYLRLIFGNRFAFVYAGLAQLVYLVLFSFAFLFKGLTGLAITVCAVLTLFVLMQVTAKLEWAEVFGRGKREA
jgi:inner membrane protein involved in colicin E2 resistance